MIAALSRQTGSMAESEYLASLEKTFGFRLDEAQLRDLAGTAPSGQPDQTDQ